MPRTRLQRPLALLAVLLAGALCAAPAASGDVGETIILRCTHGESLAGFSPSAYAKALKELEADAEEYTNCASLIRQAQLAAAGGQGASGGPLTALSAGPAEQQALAAAAHTRPPTLHDGGQLIEPGVVHANVASAFSTLPSPLLAVLAILLACAALIAGNRVRDKLRGQRPD